jgi:hypothetical protein
MREPQILLIFYGGRAAPEPGLAPARPESFQFSTRVTAASAQPIGDIGEALESAMMEALLEDDDEAYQKVSKQKAAYEKTKKALKKNPPPT